MIMVSDIFNKPKIKIFPDSGTGEFYNNCKTREIGIKEVIATCTRSFNYHIRKLHDKENKLRGWKLEQTKLCGTNLGNYLEHLLEELDKEKIEEHCKLAESLGERFIPFLPDMILLMINSFQGAIETDLHWVTDLTISDSIDISIGDFNVNHLEKYLPSRIKEIQQLLQELKTIEYVSRRMDSINEVIACYENNHRNASNVLLLTIIEGLVRSHGIVLVVQQGLQVNPLNKREYSSLEGFLKKIPWKKDLQINCIKYGLLTGTYSSYKSGEPEFIPASLTERLGFLCRRFKDFRNVILHGEETQYANILNSFLNFSALREVLLTIRDYQTVYK